MKDDRLYLIHISECLARIGQYTAEGKDHFFWPGIAGFRNVLAHGYLGINLARVWEIVERHVPDLKRDIEAILQGLP